MPKINILFPLFLVCFLDWKIFNLLDFLRLADPFHSPCWRTLINGPFRNYGPRKYTWGIVHQSVRIWRSRIYSMATSLMHAHLVNDPQDKFKVRLVFGVWGSPSRIRFVSPVYFPSRPISNRTQGPIRPGYCGGKRITRANYYTQHDWSKYSEGFWARNKIFGIP